MISTKNGREGCGRVDMAGRRAAGSVGQHVRGRGRGRRPDGTRAARRRAMSDVNEDFGSYPPCPATAPVLSLPSFSFHVPSSPSFSVQVPPTASFFYGDGAQSPAPVGTQGDYDHLSDDEAHYLRRGRGYARNNLKAVLKAMQSYGNPSASDRRSRTER